MLEVLEVACVRGERTLFSDTSFALDRGTLLRVTGANGSGKTSLLRIVCGLSLPAQGEVRWAGKNIHTLKEHYCKDLVYVGHVSALKNDLSAIENLDFGAALAGRRLRRDTARAALEVLGVEHCAQLPARVLSQGQRCRVALARLVTSKTAPLWILDEPFTALDRAAMDVIAALIADHVGAGGIAILTTHQDVPIPSPVQVHIDLG